MQRVAGLRDASFLERQGMGSQDDDTWRRDAE